MLDLIIFILIAIYIRKYYKCTEKSGYFKSIEITTLLIFCAVGFAIRNS